jgi:3-oxoadipyl-CoA thiolase
LPEALIVDALRTPMGAYRGALSGVRPDDLAAHVVKAAVERNEIDPSTIADVFFGAANQAGEDNRDVARMAALLAGLPVETPGVTVNRLCASGLEAINGAARALKLGEGDVYLAGGVESMSRAPWVMPKPAQGLARGEQTLHDTTLGWRMINPLMAERYSTEQMGETAENVAERHSVSRDDQDAFALRSHQRAVEAGGDGRFDQQIVPTPLPPKRRGEDPGELRADEGPRADTSLEKLATLKPIFREGGTVTAGNASTLNDGAACLVLASEEAAAGLKAEPLARIVSFGVAGVDPAYMGMGPVPAVRKALAAAKLEVDQIDLIELNEAFAAQALAVMREWKFTAADLERTNVHGSGISLGHPVGATGGRMLATLARELNRQGARYGLETMCIGGGQGLAAVFERVGA